MFKKDDRIIVNGILVGIFIVLFLSFIYLMLPSFTGPYNQVKAEYVLTHDTVPKGSTHFTIIYRFYADVGPFSICDAQHTSDYSFIASIMHDIKPYTIFLGSLTHSGVLHIEYSYYQYVTWKDNKGSSYSEYYLLGSFVKDVVINPWEIS